MIPEIGIMIGGYTIVRMLSLITRGGNRAENLAVKLLAAIVAGVSLIGIWDLWIRLTGQG